MASVKNKMRIDAYIFSLGMAKSRTRAADMISRGLVSVDGAVVTKPSFEVKESSVIKIAEEEKSFVGRGGLKLDGALRAFRLDVSGLICADIGASTGGFTDCLLRNGAQFVYAVDAGHGQLDESLAGDPRVKNIEGCNARFLDGDIIPEKCDVAVCDLSFISQTLVIPAIRRILSDNAVFVTLIKPQFECGREALCKNGIVKDKKQHITAIRRVLTSLRENGFAPTSLIKSPIKGGDGNCEFLVLSKIGGVDSVSENDIKESVQ